ncbi:MAG: TolC family protein [Bryobacteraceae bacterium]|jgi:outer membrane protein TolC
MISIQRGIAVVCVVLLLAPVAGAQGPAIQSNGGGLFSGLTRNYRYREVAPVDLSNSNRLESLLRAGNIYLSLQDTIALALENNLDIAYQRYGGMNAAANLLRTQAGGLLRGVSTSVQSATTSGLSQAGVTSVAGTASAAASSGSSAGGTIVTATGTSIPNYDPSVYWTYGAFHQSSPQANTVTTGTTSVAVDGRSSSVGFSQGFVTGTSVSLGWTTSTVSSNNLFNNLNPNTASNVSLTVTQRLLQGFGLAVNNRNIRVARNSQKVTDLAFKQQVIATVAQIVAAYWDLVSFGENVKVKEQALALSQRLYEDNKKQVEIGTLAPIEIVRAESEVATNQQALVNARTQVLQQETLLKNALSRTGVASPSISEAHIIPTDRIRVLEPAQVEPVQDLVARALENRPEVAQGRISIESTKIGLEGTKQELRPSLDVQASLQNNGLAGQRNPLVTADPFFIGGFGTTMSQVFARNFPSYSLGFQLSVPIRNRAARADMVMDQISLRQQELSQQRLINSIRVDVRNALIAVQQAQAAYQAAAKARTLAEQVLDAEQKKYALGASTIFFVIQYQRDLAQARSNEVTAESASAKAQVQLDQATGRTLDVNNISIDEALKGKVARAPSALPAVP